MRGHYDKMWQQQAELSKDQRNDQKKKGNIRDVEKEEKQCRKGRGFEILYIYIHIII